MKKKVLELIQLGYSVEFRMELTQMAIIVVYETATDKFIVKQYIPLDHSPQMDKVLDFCQNKIQKEVEKKQKERRGEA